MSSKDDSNQLLLLLLIVEYLLNDCLERQAQPVVVTARARPMSDFDQNLERGIQNSAERIRAAKRYMSARTPEPVKRVIRAIQPSAPPAPRGSYNTDYDADLPGSQLTRQAVLAIAQHAGFPDPKLAAAIAFAESGGVPRAVKRSSKEVSVGLWQINTKVQPYSVDDMRDPIKNSRAAFQISRGGTDWRPWTTYRNGAYRKFQTGIFA